LKVAGATLAIVASGSFLIQVVGLARADHSDLIAVRVIAQLEQYGSSRATMTLGGTRFTAVCRDRWDHQGHVETVSLDDGRTLVMIGNRLTQKGRWALDAFELAGCPRTLARWLEVRLDEGERVTVSRWSIRKEHLYALRAPAAHFGLELVIPRSGGLPIELAISGAGLHGTSEVRYGLRPVNGRLPGWLCPRWQKNAALPCRGV
jgi:hypothetical protein